MQNLFKKLAIVDENDLTKRAVIVNIAEGVDGATAFGYENEYDMISIENMQELPYSLNHTLEIRGLPTSSVTDYMDHFNDPAVDTKVSVIGTDGAMLALDPLKMEWIDKPNDGRVWKLKATAKTVPYREKNNGRKGGGIHLGENLLDVYSWADTDGDNIANGFSITNFTSPVFTGGQQSLDHANDGSLATFSFEDLFLPFSSEELTFAINMDSLTLNGHTLDVRIEFFDELDSVISTATFNFSTSGRKSVSANIPSSAVHARVSFASEDDGTATGTSSYTLSDPSLRVDGEDTYTAY